MSTEDKISSTSWLLAYVRRIFHHLLHKTKTFAALSFNILFRPRWTASNVIIDDEPAGVLHALRFYSKTFALAFMIYVIASRFKLYEGDSEWRILITTAVQVIVATMIIYVLCLALPERIPILRLIQAVLYVDGAFIVVSAALSILISYLDLTLRIPAANRELDIFGTEYERCLTGNSILYWLLRGDLKFFLYNDVWKPQDWANWFFDNYDYVLVIPFIFVFALTLRPARKISCVLICIFTAIGYATAVEGTNFIKRRLNFMLAVQDTKCTSGHIDQVVTKYAPDLIARQIVYKINNGALKAHQYFAVTSLKGTAIIATLKLNENVEPTWQTLGVISSSVRQSYCSNYIYWIAARRINYSLLVVISDKDNRPVHQQQFTPRDCPMWPALR